MTVFEQLPKDFFRILTGRNQGIYVEALLVLRESFRMKELHIDRDVLVVRIADRLSSLGLTLDLQEEEQESGHPTDEDRASESQPNPETGSSESSVQESPSFMAFANRMLRRLQATGWVETEHKARSFDLQVTLPPYSVEMVDLLYGLTQEDTHAYRNHAFATYSFLKSVVDPDSREHAFLAMEQAVAKSQELDGALKVLLNNIRRYHRKLSENRTANELLQEHFDGYQQLVNERIFHPMVTRDSVLRFRQPVLSLLERIMDDDALVADMVHQGIADRRFEDQATGSGSILGGLRSIEDVFTDVDRIMLEIQEKNHLYTKAATDKMIYLLNQDRGVKEKTAQILMRFSRMNDAQRELVADGVSLFRQEVLDERSILIRSARKIRTSEPALPLRPRPSRRVELEEFLRSSTGRYGHRRVMEQMGTWFSGMPVVGTDEIRLETEEDFVLLLLGALKAGERRTFYDVEFPGGTVERDGYRYPRMRFVRRRETP